ncbi:MAG TPA: threonine/serine exporter family protein, partial [Thermomonas sp.]|nr:threonine/serine exporter family protein [Thermomonas sp.]
GAFAFAVLFRAHRRDYPLVMASAIAGYLISRFGGEWVGAQAGLFLSALVTTAAGNLYARWRNRPGALVRLPGLIMLVPGSIALRGVITLVQAQDIGAGQDAAMLALNTLMALLAGLLFGNLLVSARRNL